ncbi:MAG: tetratricopeptide repeat protein [Arenimonas sp.]
MRRLFIAALFAVSVAVSGIVHATEQSAAASHLNLGNEHYNAGRFDQAAAEYSRAIAINPRFVNAYYNRGVSYKRAGQYELAIADFTKAISRDAEDLSLYVGRANVYVLQKNYDRAEVDYEKSIRLQPGETTNYFQRAEMRLEQNKFEAAIADYSKVISIDPKQSVAYLNRGVAYARSGKSIESFADYRRAISAYNAEILRTPTNINAYFDRGMTYANLEEYSSASADFTAIIKIDPNTANAYYERANAYEAIMDLESAKADRRKYTQLGGTRPMPQPRRNFYSSAKFFPEAALAAFARGNSTIHGMACTKYRDRIYRASGARVSLFPVTPYFDAWYTLREKMEGKYRAIFMSNEAVSYRVDLIANQEGRFSFPDLKPGRYFIQIFHQFTSRHAGRADRGASTDMINGVLATTNYYEDYDYNIGHSNRMEKFVEIKTDGDSEKVTLLKGGGLLKLGGCSW